MFGRPAQPRLAEESGPVQQLSVASQPRSWRPIQHPELAQLPGPAREPDLFKKPEPVNFYEVEPDYHEDATGRGRVVIPQLPNSKVPTKGAMDKKFAKDFDDEFSSSMWKFMEISGLKNEVLVAATKNSQIDRR